MFRFIIAEGSLSGLTLSRYISLPPRPLTMDRRLTRSSARAASLATANGPNPDQTLGNGTSNPSSSTQKAPKKSASKPPTNGNQSSTKRRKTKPDPTINELPHNLGAAITVTQTGATSSGKENIPIKTEPGIKSEIQDTVDKATVPPPAKPKAKKAKTLYGLTPGISPFPDWPHPTPDECEEVNRLLSSVHGEVAAPKTVPEPSLTVTGCGEVPSVLDALIRTLLSGATTGANSARAFGGLVERFGILEEGIGKGSVNWDAVRQASLREVFDAIKSGGLADVKSKNLKAILDMVHAENQARRDILVKGEADGPSDLLEKGEGGKQYEIACADQNFLSLNHLHSLSTEQAMVEMVKYPGIGPKTAACVLLFCLQRPCFAVDTHIFRISKWLNWVPPTKASEVTTFSHLEVRIPDHLKYSLHQLLIRHGKTCPRCRAITGQSSAGWADGCVIDHLVTRTGKRKGGSGSSKKAGRQSRSAKESESESESELTEPDTESE